MKCKDCACYKDEWCSMLTHSPDPDMERDCGHFIRAQRWVPVTERLPETDGENTHAHDVLVYIPKRDGCNQHGIYVGKVSHIPPDDGRGNFWGIKTEASDWTVLGWSYFETPVVTHWMPLPEPPEVSE